MARPSCSNTSATIWTPAAPADAEEHVPDKLRDARPTRATQRLPAGPQGAAPPGSCRRSCWARQVLLLSDRRCGSDRYEPGRVSTSRRSRRSPAAPGTRLLYVAFNKAAKEKQQAKLDEADVSSLRCRERPVVTINYSDGDEETIYVAELRRRVKACCRS